MKEYFTKLFATLLIVAVMGLLLVLLYTTIGLIGLLSGFILFMGFGIWLYRYTNKKERCPKQ